MSGEINYSKNYQLLLCSLGEPLPLKDAPPGPLFLGGDICWKIGSRSVHGVAAYTQTGAVVTKSGEKGPEAQTISPYAQGGEGGVGTVQEVLEKIISLALQKTADPALAAEILFLAQRGVDLLSEKE